MKPLLLLTLYSLLCAADTKQLVLVLAEGFQSPTAILQRYERRDARFIPVGEAFKVNLGRNGLGWGEGMMPLSHAAAEPQKREGDGKAPAGIFALTHAFGYDANVTTALPYIQATPELICVDASSDPRYNSLLHVTPQNRPESFEWMRRDDDLYMYGVLVAHNSAKTPKKGSCIFLHVQKGPNTPSAGCTTMPKPAIQKMLSWLDAAKEPLLIQLPRAYCSAAASHFKGIRCLEHD